MDASPAWSVKFNKDPHDRFPVREWLAGLDPKSRARIARTIGLLETHGPQLGMPHSGHVRGKLRELRISFGRHQYRILYFAAAGREFVLLHGFAKKTTKIPVRELAVAEKRMAEEQARRPAGSSQKGRESNAPS